MNTSEYAAARAHPRSLPCRKKFKIAYQTCMTFGKGSRSDVEERERWLDSRVCRFCSFTPRLDLSNFNLTRAIMRNKEGTRLYRVRGPSDNCNARSCVLKHEIKLDVLVEHERSSSLVLRALDLSYSNL